MPSPLRIRRRRGPGGCLAAPVQNTVAASTVIAVGVSSDAARPNKPFFLAHGVLVYFSRHLVVVAAHTVRRRRTVFPGVAGLCSRCSRTVLLSSPGCVPGVACLCSVGTPSLTTRRGDPVFRPGAPPAKQTAAEAGLSWIPARGQV